MELRHLRYFVTVAEELHFGRAARRLNLAQPPLSQQIRGLEDELGGSLFLRTSRKVELTEAGRLFLDEARLVLAQADKARATMSAAGRGEAGRISIGFVASAVYMLLPQILKEFNRQRPHVELRCHEMYPIDQAVAFQERRLNVSFTRTPFAEQTLSSCCIAKEGYILALPSDHPRAKVGGRGDAEPQRLSDFANEGFILFPRTLSLGCYDGIIASCLRAGFSPRMVQEGATIHTVVSLVAAGLGVALVPASFKCIQHPGVVYRELHAGECEEVDLTLNWREEDESPLVRAFIDVAQAVGKAQSSARGLIGATR